MFLLPQKLVLKDVQGRTSLSCLNPLKQVWFLETGRNALMCSGNIVSLNPLKQVWGKLGDFFFFSDKKKKSPITPKRKMTGKEGAYPVYPLYNHPSKKNVIVCKTNLPVFLTNFSSPQLRFSGGPDAAGSTQQRVFAPAKTRPQQCTRMYTVERIP